MRPMHYLALISAVVVSGAVVLEAQRSRVRPSPPSAETPAVPAPSVPAIPTRPGVLVSSGPVQPTRLRVEFFQVVCPVTKLAQIPFDALSEGNPSAEELVKRLRDVGDAKLVARTINTVDLASESNLTEGTRLPTVQDVRVSSRGDITPSVTYEEVGMIVRMQGAWMQTDAQPVARVRCSIELSSIGKTGVKVASGVQLPNFQQFKIEQQLALEHDKPVLILSNNQASPSDEEGRCAATVVRITAWRLPVAGSPAE